MVIQIFALRAAASSSAAKPKVEEDKPYEPNLSLILPAEILLLQQIMQAQEEASRHYYGSYGLVGKAHPKKLIPLLKMVAAYGGYVPEKIAGVPLEQLSTANPKQLLRAANRAETAFLNAFHERHDAHYYTMNPDGVLAEALFRTGIPISTGADMNEQASNMCSALNKSVSPKLIASIKPADRSEAQQVLRLQIGTVKELKRQAKANRSQLLSGLLMMGVAGIGAIIGASPIFAISAEMIKVSSLAVTLIGSVVAGSSLAVAGIYAIYKREEKGEKKAEIPDQIKAMIGQRSSMEPLDRFKEPALKPSKSTAHQNTGRSVQHEAASRPPAPIRPVIPRHRRNEGREF